MSHTLAQVVGFPIGTVIPQIADCVVEKVFPSKTGEGQYGPWKLQGLVLRDGDTKIKATAFDMDDLDYLQGKVVSLASTGKNGKTGKQTGVSIEADKKDGTPCIAIKGKQGGFIGGDKPNPAYMRGATPAAAPAASPAPASAPAAALDPKETLARMAGFWLACWAIAGKAEGLSEGVRQSMTASLFIEGNKQNLWRSYPTKPAADQETGEDPY